MRTTNGDLELAVLDVQPLSSVKPTYDENNDDDDDDDHGALLGDGQRHSPAYSSPRDAAKLWPQIKGLVIECAPTLLLTTVGLLFTGELLDHVSKWRAMREVDQLIMIIPVVLNLKGNLEMNLSARLGTAANVGELDDKEARKSMIWGNLSLLQVQAAVVSFVAGSLSLVLSLIMPRTVAPPSPSKTSPTPSSTASLVRALLDTRRPRPVLPPARTARSTGLATFVMVVATSMSAACLSSIVLGSFMCALIVGCRHFGWDPDNIAPPVASCLGDLVTLTLIGLVSTVMIPFLHTPFPFFTATLVVLIAIACLISTRRNEYVRPLLTQGWTPLFGAMIISSGTGIILDLFVTRYQGYGLLAVVISGLPGSVGAVFVSRLSTALHLESGPTSGYHRPIPTTSASPPKHSEPSAKLIMITLLLVTIPIEIFLLGVLRLLGWLKLPFLFVAFSVIFFCCAVAASLVIARYLTNWLWSKGKDPDMYALPLHSALMDLIAQTLLVLCYELVAVLGAKVRSKTG